jgi:uncharacterized protein YjgD (DUF1641 family)
MHQSTSVLQAIADLIDELTHLEEVIEDDGLLDEHREELQGQSGTINTILEKWKEV